MPDPEENPAQKKQDQNDERNSTSQIDTGGGAHVGGDVNTGDDFIGRDKHVHGDKVDGDKIAVSIDNCVRDVHIYSHLPLPPIPARTPPVQRRSRARHFKNREKELEQLLANLQPGQVVTICGPGGIGKTALAAEVVQQLSPSDTPPENFPDGVVWYSFQDRGQVDLAFEHIARSFGEELQPTPALAAQRVLAGKRVLLVFDGAEQADNLPAVLAICDLCGVLVTSRKADDTVDGQPHELSSLPPTAAISLLQDWGQGLASDSSSVERICELIGHLPLAVSIVGRYLIGQKMYADEYLEWLEKTPLSALGQGSRQENSVPLLLKSSLEQVSKRARKVMSVIGLLALAPFDAEIIAEALAEKVTEIRPLLGELVNYGLLLRRERAYVVHHALVRTYTRRELLPSAEVVSQLVSHYVDFAHQPKQGEEAFVQLNRARPHILSLLEACVDQKHWTAVNELAKAIQEDLNLWDYEVDRVAALESGLAAAQALNNRQEEGEWLGALGPAHLNLGDLEKAQNCLNQAIVIARESGDRYSEGIHLGNLGSVHVKLEEVDTAIDLYTQALAIARESDDHLNEGLWLSNLGWASMNQGKTEIAIDYYEQALIIFSRKSPDRRNEGKVLINLGKAYHDLNKLEMAIEYYQQALNLIQKVGDRYSKELVLINLGKAHHTLKKMELAIDYYQKGLAIAQEINDHHNEGRILIHLANVYFDLGQTKLGIDYYQQSLPILEATKSPYAEKVRNWLDEVSLQS